MKRVVKLLSAMFLVAIALSGCQLPITAINNSMLGLMADSGLGTKAYPYIIKDKTFDMAGKYDNAGIHIRNTTAYVIIRNITILNGSQAMNNKDNYSSANDLGIFLENVSNVKIEDCDLENNNMGIWLEGCQAVSVSGCTVKNNRYRGIYLMDSSNCVIDGNTVYSDSSKYGDDILLNTNFKKPESVCTYNTVINNDTETIRLMGNSNTDYNQIIYNYWQVVAVPSTIFIGSQVGTHNTIIYP